MDALILIRPLKVDILIALGKNVLDKGDVRLLDRRRDLKLGLFDNQPLFLASADVRVILLNILFVIDHIVSSNHLFKIYNLVIFFSFPCSGIRVVVGEIEVPLFLSELRRDLVFRMLRALVYVVTDILVDHSFLDLWLNHVFQSFVVGTLVEML